LKSEHYLNFDLLGKYFQYLFLSIHRYNTNEGKGGHHQAFLMTLIGETLNSPQLFLALRLLLVEILKLAIRFIPSSKLKEIFSTSNQSENVTMTIEGITNYLQIMSLKDDSDSESEMNEQGLNVWLFNKMLNILCFCFEINYHAIFFLEKNQTNTFKSTLMKDEKNPFVMEFHEQFYSLMFYGNMDKSLIMRIKKDVNTLSLNDFMSVTDNGENYTDQGTFWDF
jgi:hypothetical protein